MLPSRNRLRSTREFTATTRGGKRFVSGCLVVHALLPQEPSSAPARIGLTVGKSVGNAVTRHRVSRQIRHAVAKDVDRLPQGSTLVVRALPASASATPDVLAGDLRAALAGLLGTGPR